MPVEVCRSMAFRHVQSESVVAAREQQQVDTSSQDQEMRRIIAQT